ncbi:MAG TPA: DUF3617 domain-containing protein [Gallionellaceae bacterium]
MKRGLFFCAGWLLAAISWSAHAAPGEYWEVTSQMDMPGMPMAMPAQKVKVCIPKGGESDPSRTQSKDSNCTFTDVQHSGNTVKFKGTCVNGRGDKMNVSGETTHDANSFKTAMQMSGAGRGGQMSMNSSGKRVGGSCDSEEAAKKAQAQGEAARAQSANAKKDLQARACDTTNSDQLLMAGGYYGGSAPLCTNKKEYCQAVRDKVTNEPNAYVQLANQEEQRKKYVAQGIKGTDETSVMHICGLDLASMKKSVCKNSVHRGPADFLDKYCTAAEAKEFREYARAQTNKNQTAGGDQCSRDFTAPDQRAACRKCSKYTEQEWIDCMEKDGNVGGSKDVVNTDPGKTKDSGKSKTDTVLDGAKKLKGLLPF